MAQPPKGEIINSFKTGLGLYTNALLANPDPILRAKNGGNVTLYDELLRDDQIGPCFEQRRRAVVQSEWEVEPGGPSALDTAAADSAREILKGLPFDEITDQMLYAMLHGYGVAEVIWGKADGRVTIDAIKVRKRDRFRWDRDGRLRLLDITNPQGKVMPERKFWTVSVGGDTADNPYGRGLGYSLYWPAFFKRNAIKFWMIYLDKFAMPTAVGKVSRSKAGDQQEMNKVLQMLGAIQTDSAVAIPEDVEVDLLEAVRSGSADYSVIVDRMDKAISKIVLSQTMTTDNGGSRAQATVHKEVRDEVVKGDADLISDSLNQTVLTWLTEWNHPGAKPPRVWRQTEPEADLNLRAERDQKVSALGYEPTEEYIAENYGPGWRKKQAPTLPPMGTGAMPEDFTEISELARKRVAHRADQRRLTDAAEALSTKYPALVGNRVDKLLAYLDDTDDVDTFKERLAEMFTDAPDEDTVATVRNATLVGRLMGKLTGQR